MSSIMKSILLPFFVLLLTASLNFAQPLISISGRVTSTSTGAGLSGEVVTINIIDSLTTNILFTATTSTDSLGYYGITFSISNVPASGTGDANVTDCNGQVHSLHFAYSSPTTTYSNFNFVICPPLGSCNAAFVATTTPGSPTVNLTDLSTISGGSIQDWFWTMGNGDTLQGQQGTYTYQTTGTYTVCLTIVTTQGCSDFSCQTVMVGTAAGPCQSTLAFGPLQSGGIGFTATGTSTTAGFVSYFYDFGDGNQLQTSNAEVPYTYPNGGSYNACVTVLFADSCVNTTCITVNAGSGQPCQADFYAVPDTTGQFSLLLIDNSFGNNLQYSWDFGDGGTSSVNYPQHTYAGPGTYYICLTVVDSPATCTANFCDSITVINKLNTPFTINVVPSLATATPDANNIAQDISFFPNPAQDQLKLRLSLATATAVTVEWYNLQGLSVQRNVLGKLAAGQHEASMDVSDLPQGMYLARVIVGGKVETRKLAVTH